MQERSVQFSAIVGISVDDCLCDGVLVVVGVNSCRTVFISYCQLVKEGQRDRV